MRLIMSEPTSTGTATTIDLGSIERELRQQDAYLREGHTARTLVRESDLRLVLVAMRTGSHIAEHHTDKTASVHALSGHVRLRLPDRIVDLTSGQIFVIEPGLRHAVDAVADSAFLLTLGWKAA